MSSREEVLEKFREFLRAGKVADKVDEEVRQAYSVPTKLEDPVAKALAEGRDVVVAGSAGSGKTHLIRSLESADEYDLPKLVDWPEDVEPSEDEFIRVVRDVSELVEEPTFLSSRPANCRAVIVAANEGPLLELAQGGAPEAEVFGRVVKMLRHAQRGHLPEVDEDFPVVVDMAGYDPVKNDVVADLLGLDLLDVLVGAEECCGDPTICPRKIAWKQLHLEPVRQRLNDLLRYAHIQGTSLLFRELWNFLADIALGGSCDGSSPTSPWFWRVFNGKSRVSRLLSEVADPGLVVFPRVESMLYHGDWNSVREALLPKAQDESEVEFLIPTVEAPFDDSDVFDWLKTQMFFLYGKQSVLEVIGDQVDLALARFLGDSDATSVVEQLNRYMTYDVLEGTALSLDLWTDLGVERRGERVRGQVSLGRVKTNELAVRSSFALVNEPDIQGKISGSRHFLVLDHEGSSASLDLTPEVISLLKSGRSSRTAHRPHTDLEWYIAVFYTALAQAHPETAELNILALNFSDMSGKKRRYRLSLSDKTVQREKGN